MAKRDSSTRGATCRFRAATGAILAAMVVVAVAPRDTEARLKVGYRVKSIQVRDARNNPATIPDLGRKILTLFYTDPDVQEQNEPFRDALKAAKLDRTFYRGLGVVNMKDTWKPNFAIRSVVRKKIAKFKSTILTDVDHTLRDKWGLGDVNDKDVVIVIGADSKVKYLKTDGAMSAAEIRQGLALVKQLIEDLKASKAKKK